MSSCKRGVTRAQDLCALSAQGWASRRALTITLISALILALSGCVSEYPEAPSCFPERPTPASLARDPEDPLYSDQCCAQASQDCAEIFSGVVSQDAVGDTDCAPSLDGTAMVCVHRCARVEGCTCLRDEDCCPDNDPSCLMLRCGSPLSFGIQDKAARRARCAEFGVDAEYCLYCDSP